MSSTALFPTASNIAVFLNGIHVELAYGFQYKESIPKIPIYGYNDYEYTKVARGKGIVQGMVVINFTFPGYLTAVLDKTDAAYNPKLYNYDLQEASQSSREQHKETIRDKLRYEMPPNTTTEDRAARAEFIAALISPRGLNKNREETKKALIDFFTPKARTGESTKLVDTEKKLITNPLLVETTTPQGNELDIYYQDPELASYFTRFTNVEFTETSQQMSQAGAEGSSEPLYMIHQFISRSVQIKQIIN